MISVNVPDAQSRLADLIDAAVRGEEVAIERADGIAVRLEPVKRREPRPRFGSARGLLQIPDDFDAPLDDFRDLSA